MTLGARLFGTVLLVGAGALAVGAVLAAPHVLRVGRPLAREALRRGMEFYGRARAATAELAEDVEDLVAEVQSEIRHSGAEPPREANEA